MPVPVQSFFSVSLQKSILPFTILMLLTLNPVLAQQEQVRVGEIVFDRSVLSEEKTKLDYVDHLDNVVDSLGIGRNNPVYQATLHQLESTLQNTQNISDWIEVSGDSIWNQRRKGEELIGPATLVVGDKPVRYFYNESRTKLQKSLDLANTGNKYEIRVDKNDRKTIAGFDCYKVYITESYPDDASKDHHEMYVTDAIDLPLFAAFNISTTLESGFPLELKSYNDTDVLGLTYFYRLKRLRKCTGDAVKL